MDGWQVQRLDFFPIKSVKSGESTKPHEAATVFTDFVDAGMRETLRRGYMLELEAGELGNNLRLECERED